MAKVSVGLDDGCKVLPRVSAAPSGKALYPNDDITQYLYERGGIVDVGGLVVASETAALSWVE